jgi:predicted GNAT family acetyltransferase
MISFYKFLENINKNIQEGDSFLSYKLGSNYAYIAGLSVPDNLQGKGIGTKLIYNLVEICKKNNIKKIYTEQHDLDGRIYNILKKFGKTLAFINLKDAEDIYGEDIEVYKINHVFFGDVAIISNDYDASAYSPIFIECNV